MKDRSRTPRKSGEPKFATISVITVCYNEPPDRIRKTFENIALQDYPDVEWIVVDGGSNEDSMTAINEFLDAIDVLISESDDGIYDAMNKGVACASGDFIVFMNTGDSFYNKNTLAETACFIASHPNFDCYYGDAVFIDYNGNQWAAPQIRKIDRSTLCHSMVCHQSIVARRSLFKSIGSFNTTYRLIADKDWALRSIDAGARWAFMDMFICNYDATGASTIVTKRDIEISRFISDNYCAVERTLCFFLRKYRNLKQRIVVGMLRQRYKGLPVYIAK